jgi:MarR family transcriptional regulator, negative regulator of the multidrug operon emrRAB
MSTARATNLLGALVTALQDELEAATVEEAKHGSAFPAALASMLGEPGMSIEQLRRILGLSHSGTVRLVDCLAADGMVERKAGADARTAALHLTAAGRRHAKAVLDARRAALAPALDLLSTAERAQFGRLTEKMLAGLSRGREHADHICRLCDLAACPEDSCPVECAVVPPRT